jgi:hypothetical protein
MTIYRIQNFIQTAGFDGQKQQFPQFAFYGIVNHLLKVFKFHLGYLSHLVFPDSHDNLRQHCIVPGRTGTVTEKRENRPLFYSIRVVVPMASRPQSLSRARISATVACKPGSLF